MVGMLTSGEEAENLQGSATRNEHCATEVMAGDDRVETV